ncbi:hypothetical protein ACHHYP_11863 [Achlya hypogyna]|uniref:Uncharacterized protein n=1 Tax=Achlya hypogyna TaxID=1202772 RepID=A0A1V9YI63_ACHHY|nr:hypothetical protein ACHHYP_11863 [Achlya hypogyna]
MDDAATVKRRLSRDKKRAFRRKVLQQLDFLRTRVAELEADLAMRQPTALPWRDVAIALREDVAAAHTVRMSLRQELERQQALARAMSLWIEATISVPVAMGVKPAFHAVTLSKDPNARQLGLDWLTKQLFHHAHAVMGRLGLPVEVDYKDFRVAAAGSSLEFALIQRRILGETSISLVEAAFTRLYDRNSFQFVSAGRQVLDNALPGMVYSRDAHENIVYRAFVSATEYIHVSQSIHDDHIFPSLGPSRRNKTAWIVVHALGDGSVIETKLFANSVAVDEELAPDDHRTAVIEASMRQRAFRYLDQFNRDLDAAFAFERLKRNTK